MNGGRHARRRGLSHDLELSRRLLHYVRPELRLVATSVLLLLVTASAGLASTWLIKLAIDRHLVPGTWDGYGTLVAAIAGCFLLELLGKAWQSWTIDLAGQNALLALRTDVFRHLGRLSARFYDRTPVGRLVGRVTTDVEALQELFSAGVVTILGDLLVLGGTVAILFAMSWRLTLATLLVVPLLVGVTLWVRVRVRAAYDRMVTRRSRLNSCLHEQVTGMPVVQAFRAETRSLEEYARINAEMRDAQLRSVRWESVLSALTEMLESFTIALILWFGGRSAGLSPEATPGALTLGGLFAFVHYMQRFFAPLIDLSLKYTVLQSALTAADRIFTLLDEDDVTPERATPVPLPPLRGEIAFEHVTFGYDPAQPVLRDVSFRVRPGERVAVVGATGSGKTTLFKLLARLYDVQQGRVLLDGVDVRDCTLAELRRRVGVVPQDVFLFEGDVLDNVRIGHPEITADQARAAADALHLDRVVARFPAGYRETVRERGANLSAGERQLVAFARVLAVAPPVLVLDEATANVDSHAEHLLQEAVHRLMEGRTSIVIAHRLSTVRDVDRILVLHKGRLIEEGTHEELLAAGGVYRRLHDLQFAAATAADSPDAHPQDSL